MINLKLAFSGVIALAISSSMLSARSSNEATDYKLFNSRILNSSGQVTSRLDAHTDYTLKFDISNLAPKPFITTFGGSGREHFEKHSLTSDGGFIAVGRTNSTDGDLKNIAKGGDDGIIVKYNYRGVKEWGITFGGSGSDFIFHAIESKFGGYIAVGKSSSSDGDMAGFRPAGEDAIVVRLSDKGAVQWIKMFTAPGDDRFLAVEEDAYGNIVVGGHEVLATGTNAVGMFAKLDKNGNTIWKTSLGHPTQRDGVYGMKILSNGDIVLAMNSAGNSVTAKLSNGTSRTYYFTNKGDTDVLLVRVNSTDGSVKWVKNYGGNGGEIPKSPIETPEGDIVLVGHTNSTNGDFTNKGDYDAFILKVSGTTGTKIVSKCFGGSGFDNMRDIKSTMDGGFLISGDTTSSNGDLATYGIKPLGQDALWMKLDKNLNIQWVKTLSGSGNEATQSGMELANGGYIVSGETTSNDGHFKGLGKGGQDAFIARLNPQGNLDILSHDEYISRIEYKIVASLGTDTEVLASGSFNNEFVAMDSTKTKSVSFRTPRSTRVNSLTISVKLIDNEDYNLDNNTISMTIPVNPFVITGPTIDLVANPTTWTNGNVTISVKATDPEGVKYIILPNGQKVFSNTASFPVSSNGVFSFYAVNNYDEGNTECITIKIIDKYKPETIISKNPSKEWHNSTVNVDITAVD